MPSFTSARSSGKMIDVKLRTRLAMKSVAG